MLKRVLFLFLSLFLSIFGICQDENHHIVQNGETLSRIAKKYNTTVDQLKDWNNISPDNDNISIGQELIVRSSDKSETDSKSYSEVVNKTECPDADGLKTENEEKEIIGSEESKKPTEEHYVETKRINGDNECNDVNFVGLENHSKSYSWILFLFGFFMGGGVVFVLFYFLVVKKMKGAFEQLELEYSNKETQLKNENKKLMDKIAHLQSNEKSLESKAQQYFEENIALGEKIDDLMSSHNHIIITQQDGNITTEYSQQIECLNQDSSCLFSDAIIDGYFVKVHDTPNDDAIFTLNLRGENIAEFTIYQASIQRVLANPSYLDGCDKQIVGNSSKLEIISKGQAQKDASNGKWKVTKKMNILIK